MVRVEAVGHFVRYIGTWQFFENVKLITIRVIVELAGIYCCKNGRLCYTERLRGEERVSKVQKHSC